MQSLHVISSCFVSRAAQDRTAGQDQDRTAGCDQDGTAGRDQDRTAGRDQDRMAGRDQDRTAGRGGTWWGTEAHSRALLQSTLLYCSHLCVTLLKGLQSFSQACLMGKAFALRGNDCCSDKERERVRVRKRVRKDSFKSCELQPQAPQVLGRNDTAEEEIEHLERNQTLLASKKEVLATAHSPQVLHRNDSKLSRVASASWDAASLQAFFYLISRHRMMQAHRLQAYRLQYGMPFRTLHQNDGEYGMAKAAEILLDAATSYYYNNKAALREHTSTPNRASQLLASHMSKSNC